MPIVSDILLKASCTLHPKTHWTTIILLVMKRITLSILFALLACSTSPGGCSLHPAAGPALPSAATDRVHGLRADLDQIFSDRSFANARWGVEVFSLDRSETLYERDASRLFIPASNNKIITAAVALIRLGSDYRYETRLLTDGQVREGVLKGDLIIVGTGDPLDSPQFQSGELFYAFKAWAARLKERGITKIEGALLGDGAAFDEAKLGYGWEWNDLVHAYAAPVAALQFHDNMLSIEISPGLQKGDPASVKISPLAEYLTMDNRMLTEGERTPARVKISRGSSERTIVLAGSIPLKNKPILQTVSVQTPTHYFLSALKHALATEGIDTGSCETREIRGSGSLSLSTLWTHSSPPLSELLKLLLKTSHNLFAETLTRTLGLATRGNGTFAAGKEVVEETLEQMGIQKESYVYADGSGLSRLNLTSPRTLVRVLRFIHRHPEFADFYDVLAIAAVDGTLASRMKNTQAGNNVRAKTGSIANVSAISGYVRTADGEMLAFSILANNFLASRDKVEKAQDKALERLAGFSRK